MKILRRVLTTIVVVAWVVVALLNYSVVQSLAGSMASDFLSRESGGTVRVGSMGCNPFNHLVLRNVELISPENDTVCTAHTITMRFKKFPVDAQGVSLTRLRLKDTRYHLEIDSTGLNLKYLYEGFASKKSKKSKEKSEFIVAVDDLIFDNVFYSQDLNKSDSQAYDGVGVDVKHMRWNNIRGRFRNVRVDATGGPYITCRIDNFTTRERSGLEVKKMQMNVYVGPTGISATNMVLETGDSHLEGDVLLDYSNWKSMSHFLDSVYFTVHFKEGSYGGMGDAGYWAHKLWGIRTKSDLSGRVSGPLSDFYAEDMRVAVGKATEAYFDAHLKGLPYIDSTVISANIHHLYAIYADWNNTGLRSPFPEGVSNLLSKLDFVDMNGTFDGTIHDFASKAAVNTRQGDVNVDCTVANLGRRQGGNPQASSLRTSRPVRYSGKLSSNGFAVGELAPNEWLSKGAFDIAFDGQGLDFKTMRASADGRLHHLSLRGQHLANGGKVDVSVADGTAKASVDINDALAAIKAQASAAWRDAGPSYEAEVSVAHVDLKQLKMWSDTADREAVLSFDASGRYITVNEVRNYARVTVENLHLLTTSKDVGLHSAVLTAREQNKWRNMTLNSDLMTAQMRGYFELDGFGQMWNKFADDYVPQLLRNNGKGGKSLHRDYDKIAGAMFELDMEWYDSTGLLRAFVPQLTVAHGTTLQTNYNFAEGFKPLIRSDSIGWGKTLFYNVGVSGEPLGDKYRVRVTSDEVKAGNLVLSESSDIAVESSSRNTTARIRWENSDVAIGDGDVAVRLLSDTVDLVPVVSAVIDPSILELGGRQWQLNGVGTLPNGIFGSAEVCLQSVPSQAGSLRSQSDNQQLVLKMKKEGRSDDEIEVRAVDFGLDIIEPLLAAKGLSLNGVANGSVNVGGLNEVPYLNANMLVNDLAFNGQELGNARVRSTWNAEMNQLNMYVNTDQTLQLAGYIALGGDDPELDFEATLDNVALQVVQPFVKSFSSRVDGKVSAELSVEGTVGNPTVDGFVYLDSASMQVDFLNVTYSLSDTVFVSTEQDGNLRSCAIHLNNLLLHDERGGTAVADGTIQIKSLDNMVLDIGLKSDELLCMNTTPRLSQHYYGTVVASVDGTVSGPFNDIDVHLNAVTMPGSVIGIPISDKKQVKSADFIYFVGQDYSVPVDMNENIVIDKPLTLPTVPRDDGSRFQLTIDIEGTPDLQLLLPMSTSSIDVDVKARGQGDLQMQVSSDRPFTLLGDYELNTGSMELTILGLRSWMFSIDEGSTITFPGDVSDALFDIRAAYSQRVNMVTLTGSLAGNETQKQITVENVIELSGTIDNPTINFDLRLPNADQSVQEEVFAYIDRTNERDMLNQTMSLLLLNRFYNSSTSTIEESTSVASEGYGIVANSLGSLVSGMVQFVDVNFEYKAGNALTTEQYALDISKEWNKFYFETTVGFGGEAREMSSVSTNNNMTGDMLVGYKINPRLHLFVFNRSNTNDYTRSDLPYKQGVGLKYTRDFDNFKELFGRK